MQHGHKSEQFNLCRVGLGKTFCWCPTDFQSSAPTPTPAPAPCQYRAGSSGGGGGRRRAISLASGVIGCAHHQELRLEVANTHQVRATLTRCPCLVQCNSTFFVHVMSLELCTPPKLSVCLNSW
jgi:hypothetical protein